MLVLQMTQKLWETIFILTKSNWHLYLPPTDRPLAKSIYLDLSTFNIQTDVYWINEIFKQLYLTGSFNIYVKSNILTNLTPN